MPHCVAFECNNEAKTNQDPTLRFLIFPKDENLRRAWIHAIGRTSLPKNARLCSKHFEDRCFQESYLMEIRMMGSSKMRNPLKPDAVPTIFAHRPTKAKRSSSVQREEKRQRLEVCIHFRHLFHCLVIRRRDSLYRQYLQLLFVFLYSVDPKYSFRRKSRPFRDKG